MVTNHCSKQSPRGPHVVASRDVIINRECCDLLLQIDLPPRKKWIEILASKTEQIRKYPTTPGRGRRSNTIEQHGPQTKRSHELCHWPATFSHLSNEGQGFSDLNSHQYHLKAWSKHRLVSPALRLCDWMGMAGAWRPELLKPPWWWRCCSRCQAGIKLPLTERKNPKGIHSLFWMEILFLFKFWYFIHLKFLY